jgi:hypothetical protein
MAAALVVLMVGCCNRHDTDALAACYAPDTWVHPAGWPQAADASLELNSQGVRSRKIVVGGEGATL